MKCVKLADGKIRRVTNEEAETLVQHGASFCPKKQWKANRPKKEEKEK